MLEILRWLYSRRTVVLPFAIAVGAVAGFVVGGVWGHVWKLGTHPAATGFVSLLGEIFMNLLKMIVVPLVFFSMMAGVASLGGKKLGKAFAITFTYYVITTVVAVIIGLILVNAIKPGVGVEEAVGATKSQSVEWYQALFDTMRGLFPPNLFAAAAKGKILGLLLFALIFGAILASMRERGRIVLEFAEAVNDALMRFVNGVMWFAPFGVFGLVADRLGKAGGGEAVWQELGRLGAYAGTVIAGLAIHAFLVLPFLLLILARRRPGEYAKHYIEAFFTAFSTASSAATLPITISAAENKAKISSDAARFVLPLGATVNMDGTALYEAVAAVFIAQAYGIALTTPQLIVVALTATLAAIGAAAIPQAGLVTMVMVLTAVNVPVEGIGLLLSIDWLLDRFRTTVNVWGDTVGAAFLDRLLKSKQIT